MPDADRWRVLVVDDDADICRQIKEILEGETVAGPPGTVEVDISTEFADAMGILEAARFDVVVLDVRHGSYEGERPEEAGVETLRAIRDRRFVPIVFFTGLPRLVQDLESPLVQVVEKTAGPAELVDAVRGAFDTRLPAINRALARHVEEVQRDYMWDFVAQHWAALREPADPTALAYLLARRLAMSLSQSGPGIEQLAQTLGATAGMLAGEETVHPMQYYLIPPVDPTPLAGDIYVGTVGVQNAHWVLLTPSCDLVATERRARKAERVLLARCLTLPEQDEYRQWWPKREEEASGGLVARLQSLLTNNRQRAQADRYFFLPAALVVPDLIVDFQELTSIRCDELDALDRLASLDSPFAESLLTRFVRYFGRVGMPDLDVDVVLRRLRTTGPPPSGGTPTSA